MPTWMLKPHMWSLYRRKRNAWVDCFYLAKRIHMFLLYIICFIKFRKNILWFLNKGLKNTTTARQCRWSLSSLLCWEEGRSTESAHPHLTAACSFCPQPCCLTCSLPSILLDSCFIYNWEKNTRYIVVELGPLIPGCARSRHCVRLPECDKKEKVFLF